MKTAELTGYALDWAVAKALGAGAAYVNTRSRGKVLMLSDDCHPLGRGGDTWGPSYNWAQGGPIIEREMLTVGPAKHQGYMAWAWPKNQGYWGDTPLIAAMRCFVASKLGDEIEIPKELSA